MHADIAHARNGIKGLSHVLVLDQLRILSDPDTTNGDEDGIVSLKIKYSTVCYRMVKATIEQFDGSHSTEHHETRILFYTASRVLLSHCHKMDELQLPQLKGTIADLMMPSCCELVQAKTTCIKLQPQETTTGQKKNRLRSTKPLYVGCVFIPLPFLDIQ